MALFAQFASLLVLEKYCYTTEKVNLVFTSHIRLGPRTTGGSFGMTPTIIRKQTFFQKLLSCTTIGETLACAR